MFLISAKLHKKQPQFAHIHSPRWCAKKKSILVDVQYSFDRRASTAALICQGCNVKHPIFAERIGVCFDGGERMSRWWRIKIKWRELRNGIGEGTTVYTTKLLLPGYAWGKAEWNAAGESVRRDEKSGIVRVNWDEKTRELHDSWCRCGRESLMSLVDWFFPPDKVQPINVRQLSHSAATDETWRDVREIRLFVYIC